MVGDRVSVQIHDCGKHWVCSMYDGKGGVFLYDSLYMRRTSEYLDTQLAQLYADHSQQLLITVPSIQQQKGASECGLYALAVATAIVVGINPCTQSWKQDKMREHCLNCILEEDVTPFPTNTVRGVRSGKLPVPHEIIIDLMCDCNLPEYAYIGLSGNSATSTCVQCELCCNWFHAQCVGLHDSSTINESFYCNSCTN